MTIEELKNKMCIPEVISREKLEDVFTEIADILLLHSELNIGENVSYTIEEVEFYYFRNGCFDDPIYSCSYPRNCNSGDFYFHYSGVDICFQSTQDSFGGVLIRSLRKTKGNNVGLIGGPMRCATELMNTCFQEGKLMKIKVNEKRIKEVTPQKTIRQGVDADYNIQNGIIEPVARYCYYIPQEKKQWSRTRKDVFVLKKESAKSLKKILIKKDVNDNYKNNPEERVSNIQL